jgi:hypothetical protein
MKAAEEDKTEQLYQSLVAQANASRFSRQDCSAGRFRGTKPIRIAFDWDRRAGLD